MSVFTRKRHIPVEKYDIVRDMAAKGREGGLAQQAGHDIIRNKGAFIAAGPPDKHRPESRKQP